MNTPDKGKAAGKTADSGQAGGLNPELVRQQREASARNDGQQAGRAIPDVPLAEHRNHTPFPAQYFQTVDQTGMVFHVLALKVTYDMRQLGPDGVMAYAQEQAPLATNDVWSGEVGSSSPLWESDFAPYKVKCDVLVVNAVSRPPASEWRKVTDPLADSKAGQRFGKRWPAGVALQWADDEGQVQSWHKQLTVTGPRRFGVLGLESPQLTDEVSVDWCNAYGGTEFHPAIDILNPDGTVKTRAGAKVDRSDPRNPVGKGFYKASGQPGPQLETGALSPYHAGVTQGRYPPMGLSAVARHWQPRLPLAGTYDDAWLEKQWPLPPEDFDYAYWNCAPLDQQVEYPGPGLRIQLSNLYGAEQAWSDEEAWSGSLPEHELFLLWRLHNGTMPVKPLNLDTLVIDLGAQQVYATYRGVMSAEAQVRVVESRMEQDPKGRDPQSAAAAFERWMDQQEGGNHGE